MSTGQRIKERRKALSLSAENLAAKIGVSPATVYRWEKGDIEKVPLNLTPALSEALQTTPIYLMGWSDDPEPTSVPPAKPAPPEAYLPHTKEAKILAAGIDRLPEDQRKRALAFAKMIFEQYADYFERTDNDENS